MRAGQKLTPEHLAAIRRAHLGKKASPETREKLRLSHLGKNTGAANPMFGKKHTPEALEKNRLAHLGKNTGTRGPNGYHHTSEAKARIAKAMSQAWEARKQNPSLAPYFPMFPERLAGFKGQIARGRFNPSQKRNWIDTCCTRCGATENLCLEHIIPRFLGGMNTRANAQTMCEPCNHWKHWNIDVPYYKALLALQAKQGTS